MGRILKIVIYAIILVFLYFWVMTIAKSCGSDDPVGDVVEQAESVVDGVGDVIDDTTDEFFEDEDDESDTDEVASEDEDVVDDFEEDFDQGDEINYDELDEQLEDDFDAPVEQPVKESKPAPVRKTTSTSSGSGTYMVVAGSYLVYSNAESMRDRLKRAGYNAEIVQFDGSQYNTVIAGRYSSRSSAQSDASSLSGLGIDNYVHRRQN